MAEVKDPWYLHLGLYLIIILMVGYLAKIAIIDPQEIVAYERYCKDESRLRMKNLKEAQVLYFMKNGKYTNEFDSLLNFIKNDPFVKGVVDGFDTIMQRSTNPFQKLTGGAFIPESLGTAPKSGSPYTIQIDTSITFDSVVNQNKKLLRVDTVKKIGTRYVIEDPDGYGRIGDLNNDALKNTSSWE
ncbi:MAG: hypothetical protein AMXMBFR48_14020 [Ignavibacteriales bacterium]